MRKENLPKMCKSVTQFFKKTVTDIGKAAGFVKRESKINATLFVESLLTGCYSDANFSLEKMSRLIKHRGVKVTKQSLSDRFNDEATNMMKALLAEALKEFKAQSTAVIDLLKPFSSVKLLDSTNNSLPASLKNLYPGYGGDASEAALKIQVLYDYIGGQIESASITSARQNDQSFKEHLNNIEEGALYLQDLGYFRVESFKTIQEKKAFFISRYLTSTSVFYENEQPIELYKELSNAGSIYSKKVLLGQKNKLPVRLVAYRLNEMDAQKHIRKIKETARKQGYTLTQETLKLAQWAIFITNVPENIINDEQIYLVYSLRWQIELLFKLCKSEAGIDKIKGKKSNRILCEIYAKLICVVILLYLCFPMRWQDNQELSFRKAYKLLSLHVWEFFKALSSPYRLIKFLEAFLDDLKDFALKKRRKKSRVPTYQKMMEGTGQGVLI